MNRYFAYILQSNLYGLICNRHLVALLAGLSASIAVLKALTLLKLIAVIGLFLWVILKALCVTIGLSSDLHGKKHISEFLRHIQKSIEFPGEADYHQHQRWQLFC